MAHETFGNPPYTAVCLNGGPGAAGEMVPVAEKLSQNTGIIVYEQTASSVAGQAGELHDIMQYVKTPVTLVGHSWGAWLGCIFGAAYPECVRKIVLVGCPPFTTAAAQDIMEKRVSRMSEKDMRRIAGLNDALHEDGTDKDEIFAELGGIYMQADTYVEKSGPAARAACCYRIYASVFAEAEALRRSGELIETCGRIRCPVVAIHGDYDPHPVDGVTILFGIVPEFKMTVLERCGHDPWRERYACREFYRILKDEIKVR